MTKFDRFIMVMVLIAIVLLIVPYGEYNYSALHAILVAVRYPNDCAKLVLHGEYDGSEFGYEYEDSGVVSLCYTAHRILTRGQE